MDDKGLSSCIWKYGSSMKERMSKWENEREKVKLKQIIKKKVKYDRKIRDNKPLRTYYLIFISLILD